MKNFRKVLALVLVVAMMFSFAAMASAKELKDYTDAESVSYDTAVEVLSALEILNGYEDDTFRPTNSISREEMAKMIAVMANAGDTDVDSLYAAACEFADVEKTRWSASYISYCAYTGIVAGVGENCFNPYGNVTALETAKMLLVLMGFDADEQGYVGSNWKINVLTDMQNFGLTVGFPAGYDWNDPISREEAAQMMLNALQTNVIVGVVSDNVVKITNALYAGKKIDATLIDAQKYGDLKMYGNVIVDGDKTLGEALYNNRLDLTVGVRDCYGRPGNKWTLINALGKEVLSGTFVANPLYVPVNTDGTIDIAATVTAASSAVKPVTVNYFVDGDLVDAATAIAAVGKGVQVEVYANGAGTQIDVVVKNTYISMVETTTLTTFQLEDGSCFSNKAYGLKEGQIVLYWLCNGTGSNNVADYVGGKLHEVKVAEPTVTGIKKASSAGYVVGTDGNKYEYADNIGEYTTVLNANLMGVPETDATADGATYDLYLDEFNYIMGWKKTTTEASYIYGYAVEKTGYIDWQGLTGANAARIEAKKDIVSFEDASTATLDVTTEPAWWTLNYYFNNAGEQTDILGTLVKYTVNADGAITAAAEADWFATEPGASISNNEVPMVKGNGDVVEVDKFGNETVIAYGDKDTKYLVRTYNYSTKAYEYNVYTESTLPSGFLGYTLVDVDGDGYRDTTIGTIQMFYTSMTDGYNRTLWVADYVFVDAIYGSVAASRAFVTSPVESYSDIDFVNQFEAVDVYEAVVAGKDSYVVVNDTAKLDDLKLYSACFTCIGYNTEDGYPVYVAATPVEPNTFGSLEYYNGNLWYNGKLQDVDENAFLVVAFPAGYDANANGVADDVTYAIEGSVENVNKYVVSRDGNLHAFECQKADCTGCFFMNGWVIDADGDGDIDEVYTEVFTW